MVKLETDPFLNELNKLFERNAAKGSVSITVKHSARDRRKLEMTVLLLLPSAVPCHALVQGRFAGFMAA